jgi:CubicO group peptidase (beta-lactamase class C family)
MLDFGHRSLRYRSLRYRSTPWVSVILLGLAVAGPINAQDVRIQRLMADFEPEIRRVLAEGNIPSATIALVAGDQVVWKGAFGLSNVWARTPATTNTVYLIASTFKAMSAVALLNCLHTQGIHLDAAVRDQLGELRLQGEDPARPVTYRHLLTHTSGLPVAFTGVPVWADTVPPGMVDYLRQRLRVQGPPLAAVRYSNTGFTLVGYLVQQLAGEAFREHIQKVIFDPLEMSSTAFIPTPGMQERLAVPYVYQNRTQVPAVRSKFAEWPAGMVYGTIEDQANWLILNLNGGVFKGRRIINEDLLEQMHTIQYPELARPSQDFGGSVTGYGLSWRVTDRRGERVFAHSGSVSGYTGLLVGNIDRKLGFAVLTNGNRSHPHLYRLADRAIELMKTHLGPDPTAWR